MSFLLLAIPLAYFLVYLPKIPLSMAMAKATGGYDNKNPRDQQAALTGWGRRAAAAHANGFESFAPFAIGCIIAHLTGAKPQIAIILCATHLVARTIYPVLYLANIDRLRSLVWVTGFFSAMGLMALPLF